MAANVVVATTKVRIFKQITTSYACLFLRRSCCCYHKGTYFQANHNNATKQYLIDELLLLPQRYVFSSKSQQLNADTALRYCCCCYHKGTYFQANHNYCYYTYPDDFVVVATTKVRIFKQITTMVTETGRILCCCCYHKGTYFQANHNSCGWEESTWVVVVATTKVRIFKQITTGVHILSDIPALLLLPQRYVFSSKSQQAKRL